MYGSFADELEKIGSSALQRNWGRLSESARRAYSARAGHTMESMAQALGIGARKGRSATRYGIGNLRALREEARRTRDLNPLEERLVMQRMKHDPYNVYLPDAPKADWLKHVKEDISQSVPTTTRRLEEVGGKFRVTNEPITTRSAASEAVEDMGYRPTKNVIDATLPAFQAAHREGRLVTSVDPRTRGLNAARSWTHEAGESGGYGLATGVKRWTPQTAKEFATREAKSLGLSKRESRELGKKIEDAISKGEDWTPHLEAVRDRMPYMNSLKATKTYRGISDIAGTEALGVAGAGHVSAQPLAAERLLERRIGAAPGWRQRKTKEPLVDEVMRRHGLVTTPQLASQVNKPNPRLMAKMTADQRIATEQAARQGLPQGMSMAERRRLAFLGDTR